MPRPIPGIIRLVEFNQALATATANALTAGYDELLKSANSGDLDKPWAENPLVSGSVQGFTAALEVASTGYMAAAAAYLLPFLEGRTRETRAARSGKPK